MHKLPDQSREQDDWIERIARPLRRPEMLDPSFESRLMTTIRAEAVHAKAARAKAAGVGARHDGPALVGAASAAPPSAARRGGHRVAWRWFLHPQTLRISPAAGLALAAGLAALLVLPTVRRSTSETDARAGAPVANVLPDTVTVVQFVLVAPSASKVSLVGDFNNWDPAVMPLTPTRASGGVWTISVPLSIGRYQYAFIVDGTRWMTDPSAPTAVEDDFGVPNSVVTVGERTS